MSDDFKERLRNPDHDWHEAACAEAEHRIEAQAAEIEKLRGAHETVEAELTANERMVVKLREAGNELGGYAGHDDSCDCVKGWAKGPCNCGYTETWNQWRAALGETK